MFLSSLYLENKTVYERRLIFILKNYSIISIHELPRWILLIFTHSKIFLFFFLVEITLLSSTIFSLNQLENLTIYAILNLFRDIARDITPRSSLTNTIADTYQQPDLHRVSDV